LRNRKISYVDKKALKKRNKKVWCA